MDDLLNPVSDDKSDLLPNWSFGVIAGGIALLATGATITYHMVSKKIRYQKARDRMVEIIERDAKLTPRGE